MLETGQSAGCRRDAAWPRTAWRPSSAASLGRAVRIRRGSPCIAKWRLKTSRCKTPPDASPSFGWEGGNRWGLVVDDGRPFPAFDHRSLGSRELVSKSSSVRFSPKNVWVS